MSILNNLKTSNFVKENQEFADIEYVTGKGKIFTTTTSTEAFLPTSTFYSIQIGALITANNVTGYVVSKNSSKKSVILNHSVNWNNLGNGYPFKYSNPVHKMLDKSQEIVGYVTRDGFVYLTEESLDLKTNKIIAEDENGVKIVNSDNVGIFVDSTGQVFKGSDAMGWIHFEYQEVLHSNAYIDGGTF